MARRRPNGGLDILKTGVLFGVVVVAIAYFAQLSNEDLQGRPTVIDGDSLRLDGVELRLWGIDAPEIGQTCRRPEAWQCGRQARTHLRGLLGGEAVQCSGHQTDRYDRLLVECTVGDSNINAAMVRDGYAVSFGAFEGLEADARAARRGIWASDFERPAQWREAQRGDVLVEPIHLRNWASGLMARAEAWWNGLDR